MNDFQVIMDIQEEGNKNFLFIEGIKNKIEIDFKNKKIENLKVFFEELIINSFLNETVYRMEFSEKLKNELNKEHKEIILLLIEFKEQYENSMTAV